MVQKQKNDRGSNGYANATNNDSATSSAPIHQGVRDGVCELTTLMEGTQVHIDGINAVDKGAIGPTMDNLRSEIEALSSELGSLKSSQTARLEDIKTGVEHVLKLEIAESLSGQLNSQIAEEIRAQVKAELTDWGSNSSLAESLRTMWDQNEIMLRDAQTKLANSRSRRGNSAFDQVYNFDDQLHVVWKFEGCKSELYPDTLNQLFKYNDAQVKRLLQFYELRDCGDKIDNLNRFLGFIGLTFVVEN